MHTINGIPTSAGLQRALGRTGLSAKFKKTDAGLQDIFLALADAENIRADGDMPALGPLRLVRKACVAWLLANQGKRRWERDRIHRLWKAVHARVTVIIETVFHRARSPSRQMYKQTQSFHRLTDDILRRNVGMAGKSVDAGYDIERFTARHIPGVAVDLVETRWRAAGTNLTLADWIEQVLIPQSEEDRSGRMYFGQTTQQAALFATGVKYCSPTERMDYLVVDLLDDGELLNAHFEPLHTGAMKSPTTGDGWGIFVVDLQQRLYVGPYAFGAFHHSSFLSGAPVLSAGEIAVDQGRVVGLTNKTGHYKAGPAELKRMLELLHDKGVRLNGVAVNDPFRARDQWFTGTEALQAGGDLASLGAGTIARPPAVAP